MARRKWRWAVTGEYPVGCIANVLRQATTYFDFSSFHVHENAKHFAARTAGKQDIPAKGEVIASQRQPNESGDSFARERRCREHLALFSGGCRLVSTGIGGGQIH